MSIISYLLMGCVFTILVDASIYYLEAERLNNIERFVCILLWPFALANFVYGFIKEFFKNKK